MNESNFNDRYPLAIKNGLKHLYKFMSVRNPDNSTEFLECLLIDGHLFLSPPSVFNDPFECKPYFSLESHDTNDIKKLKKKFFSLIRDHVVLNNVAHDLSYFDRLNNFFDNPENDITIDENLKLLFNSIYQGFRIYSLTQSPYNLLFWSYYANSHKGICIEFDAQIPPFSEARKVEYLEKYPEVKSFFDNEYLRKVPALSKSIEWKHENEYRILQVTNKLQHPNFMDFLGNEFLILRPNSIKSVIVGAQITESDLDDVKNILKRSKFTPKLYKASLSKTEFKLEKTFDEIRY